LRRIAFPWRRKPFLPTVTRRQGSGDTYPTPDG
jgi:hypothetical protein